MQVWVIEKDGKYLDRRTGQKANPTFGELTGWCAFGNYADAAEKVRRLNSRRQAITGLRVEQRECELVANENLVGFIRTHRGNVLPDDNICVVSSKYGYVRSLDYHTYTQLEPARWFGGSKIRLCKTPEKFCGNFICINELMKLSEKFILDQLEKKFGSAKEAQEQYAWGQKFLTEEAVLEVYKIT